MSDNQSIRIHTQVSGARAILAVGQILIDADWKQTKNKDGTIKQERKERAILIPMECVKAPEVPEAFRPLVESALLESARESLKQYVNANAASMEVAANVFTRPQLVESFMTRGETWMNQKELEEAFMKSQTWAGFMAREDFKTSPAVQKAVMQFKETVLKCAGKASHVAAPNRDSILAKMNADDLESDWGTFVVKRFDQMAKKDAVPEVDFSAL